MKWKLGQQSGPELKRHLLVEQITSGMVSQSYLGVFPRCGCRSQLLISHLKPLDSYQLSVTHRIQSPDYSSASQMTAENNVDVACPTAPSFDLSQLTAVY